MDIISFQKSSLTNASAHIPNHQNISRVDNFFREIVDTLSDLVPDRVNQELITFLVVSSQELYNPGEPMTESGIYCITDSDGNKKAYKMIRENYEVLVHKLHVHDFDDLHHVDPYNIDSINYTVVHSWDENVFFNLIRQIKTIIPVYTYIDRFCYSNNIFKPFENSKDDLSRYLIESVGKQAFSSYKTGGILNDKQFVYFISPGEYHVFSFTDLGNGVQVAKVEYCEIVKKNYESQRGIVYGIKLSDLPSILSYDVNS